MSNAQSVETERCPLTKDRIANLSPDTKSKPGKKLPTHAYDGGEKSPAVAGLLVRCQPSGRKYFYYQFRRPAYVKNRVTGEEALNKNASTRVCLGLVDDITISKARERARIARDAVRAARRAELTGRNVVKKVHEALNNLSEPVDVLEARQEAKRTCPTFEKFIDDEYADYKKTTEGLKSYQDGREIQRLKYVLSVLSKPAKKGGPFKVHADLNLLDRKLDEVDAALVRRWKTVRLQRPSDRTGKPPSRVTVERDLMILRAMFHEAVERGYVKQNPTIEKRRIKRGNKPKSKEREGLLTEEQEKRLYKTLIDREEKLRKKRKSANSFARKEGGRERSEFPEDKFVDFLRPIILLAANTGMRFGELASLKWDDISLAEQDDANGKSWLTVPDTKSGNPLHMPLNLTAAEVLRKWKRFPGRAATPIGKGALVFTDRFGKKLCNIRRLWKTVFIEAGLPPIYRFHDLRHHFASRLASMGHPLSTISVLLNHSSPSMTKRYAKHSPGYLDSVVGGLDRGKSWTQ